MKPLRPHDPRTLGEYELLGLLGEGGMGAVYLAQSRGKTVAVKIIRAEFAAQPEFRGRFRSEVNRARQVPPFCTAAVLDADPEHETPYLVVEYIDGPDLADRVAGDGPLTGGALYSVAVGVATALVAIHGAGVIHRDLKPRNVLLAPGFPKVIDFGIARALESTSEHTRTDQVVGTISYMAPERLDGGAVTPAVDVFAWGVLVAYAATGRTPFAADTPTATAVRIMTAEPDLAGLPDDLRAVVGRALAKDPADRPSAQDVLDALLTGRPGFTPPLLPPRRRAPHRRKVAGAVAAAAVVAAGALVVALNTGDDSGATTITSASAPASASTPAEVRIVDTLTRAGQWRDKRTGDYSCELGPDGLAVVSGTTDDGVTCPGPATVFAGDQSIKVHYDELSDDACALVGFRHTGRARYELTACADEIAVAAYHPSGDVNTISSAPLKGDYAARHQLVIDIVGEIATVRLDGEKLLTAVLDDPALAEGATTLGLAQLADGDEGFVRFSNIDIRA
ncbi:serine/threonine-protein kinase [Paractinoplanes atraurantiacus]|uniref:Serine/threonine protein kinase n=1 Tax=Paractinoplanes atraurantiacus TaxID=1036182 RepID=A0A285HCR7_9ACTN|nr:serine/threonine-protein kinase [Actinoplanes atraurantiacus]SNY33539.1 Serine/threonine protein kinase [Actinoplanes atraurantiacus]